MDLKNFLVVGNYEEEFNKQLGHHSKAFRFIPLEEITEADLNWADVYIGSNPCRNFKVSNFKWVHTFNAGVNNYLEMDGWQKHSVLLTRTITSFGQRISEYCLSYVLRDLQYHQNFQQNHLERNWKPKTPRMMKDQTFVILGTGEIGQAVAKTMNQFGATVYGVSRSGEQKDYFQVVADIASAGSFLSKADWVISTLPLTMETHKLFDDKFFNEMNGSVFINVGRGATVDEEALIVALNSGKIRYAILDVVTQEPLSKDSVLWERNDIVITPHISAVTEINEAITCFSDTLRRIENNEPLYNVVDSKKGY